MRGRRNHGINCSPSNGDDAEAAAAVVGSAGFYLAWPSEFKIAFVKWSHHFTFPPAMREGSRIFSNTAPTLVIVFFYYYSHPSGLDLHVLMASDVGHLIMYLLATCISCLERRHSNPLPSFKLACLFIVELVEFSAYFGCKHLIRYVLRKCFFPIPWAVISLSWWCSLRHKSVISMKFSLSNFSFVAVLLVLYLTLLDF